MVVWFIGGTPKFKNSMGKYASSSVRQTKNNPTQLKICCVRTNNTLNWPAVLVQHNFRLEQTYRFAWMPNPSRWTSGGAWKSRRRTLYARNERGKFPWKRERMLVNDSWFNLQSWKSVDRPRLAPRWLITPHQHACEQKCEIMCS